MIVFLQNYLQKLCWNYLFILLSAGITGHYAVRLTCYYNYFMFLSSILHDVLHWIAGTSLLLCMVILALPCIDNHRTLAAIFTMFYFYIYDPESFVIFYYHLLTMFYILHVTVFCDPAILLDVCSWVLFSYFPVVVFFNTFGFDVLKPF